MASSAGSARRACSSRRSTYSRRIRRRPKGRSARASPPSSAAAPATTGSSRPSKPPRGRCAKRNGHWRDGARSYPQHATHGVGRPRGTSVECKAICGTAPGRASSQATHGVGRPRGPRYNVADRRARPPRGGRAVPGGAAPAALPETRHPADDALEAIDARYETLPVVATPEAAMAGDATLVHEAAGSNVLLSRAFVQGDAEAAIARAPVVVGGRFRFHRHAGVTLENRACLADWDAGARELTLWSSTQVPALLREALAELLDLPAHRPRVVAPDAGGGFGGKSGLHPQEGAR